MINEVSSPGKTFWIRSHPLIFIVGFAGFGLAGLFAGQMEAFVAIIIALLGVWSWKRFYQKFLLVSFDDENLYLSDWSRETAVPLNSVASVSPQYRLKGMKCFKVIFQQPTLFGKFIYFAPPGWTAENEAVLQRLKSLLGTDRWPIDRIW